VGLLDEEGIIHYVISQCYGYNIKSGKIYVNYSIIFSGLRADS